MSNPNSGSDRVVLDGVGAEPVLRAGVVPFGVGCAGSSGIAPRASSPNLPTIGNANFALATSDGPPNAIAGTFLGLSIAPLVVGPCLVELANAPSAVHVLDAGGAGSVVFGIPNNPVFVGLVLHSQTVTIDPGSTLAGFLGLTRTLDVYVGN